MTDTQRNAFRVVVGFDFSEQSELALSQALDMAGNCAPAVVHVIGVLGGRQGLKGDGEHEKDFEAAQELQDEIRAATESALAERNLGDGINLFVHTRIGGATTNAANEILALAREVAANMIIIGTHGRTGLRRLVMGSVAEQIVRKASCPVLVARPQDYEMVEEEAYAPEPPCPKCVARRKETGGAEWWCEEHGKPKVQPKRYTLQQTSIVQMRPNEWALW